MYRAAFRERHLDGRYEAIECVPDGLTDLMTTLQSQKVRGLSVTMPLKEAIISHLDELTDTAAILNAVNCVVFDERTSTGHNTDGDGCCDALVEHGGASLSGHRAVVLGAGGTGRSVALALGSRGANVVVINRTHARTEELIARVEAQVVSCGGSIRAGSHNDIEDAHVVVNTTSVGMNSDESPIPVDLFREHHVVLDAVYHPMETVLLAGARHRGATVVDGLWMLVEQARRQCVLQFGWIPSAQIMRDAAEQELRARRQ
jgi:shikimate dehydrogenase